MKRILIVAAALASSTALAQAITTTLAVSKHNLSFGGPAGNTIKAAAATNGGDQICIFCHTPHKALATKLLWNRTNSTATFAAGSLTSTTALPPSLLDASAACMSCHDGSASISTVLNRGAGSAGFVGGAETTGGASAGRMSANYTVDLTNDGNHPVSLPYPGSTGNYNTIASQAKLADYRAIQPTGCTSPTKVCTVDPTTPANGLAINLTKDGAATGIECTSCHDPHGAPNAYLLRAPIGASALCLACHNK